MAVDEKYAGTTAISRLVWHVKEMNEGSFSSVSSDLAILRFNVGLSSVNADQDMKTVFVWEFPGDVTAESGILDEQGDSYYCEVLS